MQQSIIDTPLGSWTNVFDFCGPWSKVKIIKTGCLLIFYYSQRVHELKGGSSFCSCLIELGLCPAFGTMLEKQHVIIKRHKAACSPQ